MYNTIWLDNDPMITHIGHEYVRKDKRFRGVQECNNVEDALRLMEKGNIDLLIMDISFQEQDGIELIRTMLTKGMDTSVIAITAKKDKETLSDCLKLGVVDYLVKPFSPERLQIALDKFAGYQSVMDSFEATGQVSIDHLFDIKGQAAVHPSESKSKTALQIIQCMADRDGQGVTVKEVSEALRVSDVTVRRHLKKLAAAGRVVGEVDYDTGGHPRMLYRLP